MMYRSSLALFLLAAAPGLASITCLHPSATATARWTNADNQRCTWTGTVGSNFGTDAVTGGEYSCNGRCGAGCTGAAFGNAYTQDCFSHDICSWFNNASGGARDPNCGAAFDAAIDDTTFGFVAGCSATNPKDVAPMAPDVQPVCT